MSDDTDKEKELRRQALRDKIRQARQTVGGDQENPAGEKPAAARPKARQKPAVPASPAASLKQRSASPQSAPRPAAAGTTPKERPAPSARPAPPSRPGVSSKQQPTRPAAGVAARAAGQVGRTATRPLPSPPARRQVTRRVGGSVSAEVQSQINALYTRFASLEAEAQLSGVYEAIGRIENRLTELPLALDGLRLRGYVHSGYLESQVDAFTNQWNGLRPRIEASLGEHINRLNIDLDQAGRRMEQIGSGNAAALASANSAVNGLSQKIDAAKSGLSGLYSNLESQLSPLRSAIDRVKWMMDQVDESPEIRLYDSEGPIAAVKSQWQRSGDDGPEGVLYLTDQRLLFEQKEEIVTKKVLGLFKKDSEKVQKVLLDVDAHQVESIQHSKEGGFLGMGKADILELVFTAQAPVSRARFHLKGQNSSMWAGLIKRVQTGDIHRDRHERYLEELGTAEATSASFPTQCPNCFASVPTPPRGARSVTCEFCGAVIAPLATA